MSIGLILGVLGGAVSVLGLWINWRRHAREQSADHFVRTVHYIREKSVELNRRVLLAQPDIRTGSVPMLARPDWILAEPWSLDQVRLRREKPTDSTSLDRARSRARRQMPRRADGSFYTGYSQALGELAGMDHLYNGRNYRLMDISVLDGEMELSCTNGWYFDHLDTGTVLAYESASRYLAKRRILRGPYRRFLRDPFDFRRRGSGLGVNTLTIRQDANGAGFFLHQRKGGFVAEGPESFHVVPAGEFTPSDRSLQALEDDFDLWRNIMREYAEEFLDVEEAYGRGGRTLDFDTEFPFRELQAARLNRQLRVYVLGIGIDPLDWKPELLTVCIFEAATFDSIFEEMVPDGKEGVILVGPQGKGIPFTESAVRQYVEDSNMPNPGASCLKLAWCHRANLNLG